MKSNAALTVVALCCLGLCIACSDKEETVVELDQAGDSIQKAYEGTTNALKDVVEEVNDAVY